MAINLGELGSITRRVFLPKLVDNIFNSNTLLQRWKNKRYESLDGGTKVIVPLLYATSTAAGWYDGNDSLDITNNEQFDNAEFEWKHAHASVSISKTDELKNSGKLQVVDLVKSKMQAAEKTLADNIGTGIFNAGTTAKSLIGLRLGIDSTGTYGGINRSTYSWWSAQEDSTTTALSLSAMQSLYGDCTVGSDKPTFIVATQDILDDFHGLLQPQERFSDKSTADAGFTNLLFRGTPIAEDSHCPTSNMFMLNEAYWHLFYHKDDNFRMEPFVKPTNQNVSVSHVYWSGVLAASNCRMNGKFTALV